MEKGHIVIKFNKEAIQFRLNEALTLKTSATQDNFLNQFTYHPIVTDEMLLPQNKINIVNFENLAGICYVQDLDNVSLEEKKTLAKKMNEYDFVEYAYVENPKPLPLYDTYSDGFSGFERESTPYFTSTQGYKDGITPHHKGIDMEYAWSTGITGQGITCAVIDGGFNFSHISLKRENFININEEDINYEHGTCCVGIMFGKDTGFGIKGLIHGADKCYGVNNTDGSVKALVKILPYLHAGDVVSLSWSTEFAPMDYDYGFWEVAKEATQAGILICISAGNSTTNLDTDERLEEYRRRPDIGIIRVGAGDRFDARPLAFSSYGKLVHLQAWGEKVATTGGKDFFDYIAPVFLRLEENCKYTFNFFGTSSAAPIVASASVAVQSWYKQKTNAVLSPFEMRELLIKTGTPQAAGRHVGPLPNVRNAINELERHLQL